MKNGIIKTNLSGIELVAVTNKESFISSKTISETSAENDARHVHTHVTHELFAVTDGEITVTTENEKITFRDSIVIIPPYLRHFVFFNSTSAVVLNISIEPGENSSQEVYTAIMNGISQELFSVKLSENEKFYCQKLIKDQKRNVAAETYPHLISLLLLEIFSRFIPQNPPSTSINRNQYTSTIESYVAANSANKIQLADLASELHLCAKQVSRIIKKEYGCTFTELVIKHRMDVAAMLLTNTKMKTYEISGAVGYESPKDFRINFKRIYGKTPTEYRRNAQKSR